jgi:translocator protein
MEISLGTLIRITAFLALSFLPALIGSFFPPGEWYAGLRKPDFAPPDWIFGPVWTVLYLSIGVAGFLAWRAKTPGQGGWAFTAYGVQLVLNALWTVLFFGLQQPLWALVDLSALWLSLLATIVLFLRLSTAAGIVLLPYLAWISFAWLLNIAFVRLN